jgi:hypothetical protein
MHDPTMGPPPAQPDTAPVDCPCCRRPMQLLALSGHYGRQVVIDLCGSCRLVWFDTLESVNLSQGGWLQLLLALQRAAATDMPWAGRPLGCPACATTLQPVHNLTRFGRFAALECQAGSHGHLQSFALLLAERGLVRPMLPPERAGLAAGALAGKSTAACLNCGAPLDGRADACSHCTSPLVVIDLPRLAAALRDRPGDPLPRPDGRLAAWHCAGCGQAVDPSASTDCKTCGQLLAVPALSELGPLLHACETQTWARRQPPAALARPRLARDADPWRTTSFGRLLGQLSSFFRR